MKRIAAIVFILHTCLHLAWAQVGLYFTSDKLSSTTITSICQDQHGYIWIGTENGLNRFDGYQFTVYKNIPNDSTSLMFNIVNKVFCDKEGNLWVGTNTGLQRYDDTTDSFIPYTSSLFKRSRISDICQLPDGKVVVGTAGFGLFHVQVESHTLTLLEEYMANRDDRFFGHMLIDADGGLWKDSNKDFSLTRPGKRPQVFTNRNDPPMSFAEADGKVLVMNRHTLSAYDQGKFVEDYFDVSEVASFHPQYWTVMRDHLGNIYIGTRGNGLLWIPSGSRKVQRYDVNVTGINMNTSTVQALFEDRSGNLWVGCWRKGLLVIPRHKAQFTSWSFSGQKHDIGNPVSSLCQGDDGVTWCTVQNEGVFGFDAEGRLVAHPAAPAWVEFIHRDTQGHYYVGAGTEVYAYDPLNGHTKQLLNFDCNMINAMTDDGRGHLFFSVFGRGLLCYDTATGHITHHSQTSNLQPQTSNLCNDWIMSMTTDHDGRIWLATTNGVCCYDAITDSFTPFGRKTICEGKRCESLCETSQGDMLIGTMEGLYVWRRSTRSVEQFPGAGLLRGLTIGNIVQDRSGDIWCSTSAGIWHYRTSDGKWLSHVSGSGLIDKEYIANAGLYIPQADRILFAASDGITTFTPQQVQESPTHLGDIQLTNMLFGGKPLKPRTSNLKAETSNLNSQTSTFTFPLSDQVISMSFSLMNFLDAANTVFEYRLDNHAEWTRLGEGQNTITFTHLPIGTYPLEVRAIVGGAISPSRLYTITIQAPWYRTTLAYLLYFLLFVAVMTLIVMRWRNSVRMRLAQEKLNFMLKANHSLRTSDRSRVLLVDGDINMANQIIGELNSKYKFDYAPNGKEALKLLLGSPHDLVVSAVTMPVMDGITMLRHIKGNPAISDIPVVMLSSQAEIDGKLLGLKHGADAYIAKPVNTSELQLQIDNLIDNVRRLRGKFSGALQQEERVTPVEVRGNDDALMDRIMRSINAHMSDSHYNVDVLASDVGLSRAQLHRKMKEMTGISTGRFLRNLRMEQAARLLREGKVNVSQVADRVGYIDQAHFSTAFKTHFGISPSEYTQLVISNS